MKHPTILVTREALREACPSLASKLPAHVKELRVRPELTSGKLEGWKDIVAKHEHARVIPKLEAEDRRMRRSGKVKV